jgi:type I restriction enzyme S subunit
LINNNHRRIEILNEMAQAICREWFVRFRFPGHEKVKMTNSPLGKVPDGWKILKLKDICASVEYGFTASARNERVGPKFLRITDIVPTMIKWESVPYCRIPAEKMLHYALKGGDIVIARTGATTGYAKRIHKRHPVAVFASYLVRIRLSVSYLEYFIGMLVESEGYKKFIKTNVGGAAQPQANAQVLTSIPILLPPEDLLRLFNRYAEALFDEKEVLENECTILRQTRDALLPKLISGAVDVSELESVTDDEKVVA